MSTPPTNSLTNTPQAQDDSYAQLENDFYSRLNSGGALVLDVLANDRGGAAKQLYSVEDSSGALTELLTSNVETGWERTDQGNEIRIKDGKIEYRVAAENSRLVIDGLAAGEVRADTFLYAIRLGNGTLSYARVTLTFTGQNDAVTVTSGAQTGSVTEDDDTQAVDASGTVSFTDADLRDGHTASFVPAAGNTTALGSFALTGVSEAAGAAGGSVGWNYTLNNGAANYLAAGEQVTETYTITLDDGNGSRTTQHVTVTITGSNDAVSVTSGVQAGAATEDTDAAAVDASGTVTFSDADLRDGHTASFVAAAANSTSLGSFALTSVNEAAGAAGSSVGWSYTLNNGASNYLASGEQVTETYTITLDDGNGSTTTQDVTVTVTGTNDAVSVTSGAQAGAATEDNDAAAVDASGTVTFTDADLRDGHTASFVAAAANSTALGSFALTSVNEGAGAAGGAVDWTYTLDNGAANYVAAGEQVTETYSITLDDGNGSTTTQDVTVRISGTNDAPVINSAPQAAAVTELANNAAGENTLSHVRTGSLAFTDVDLSDVHSVSVAAAGAGYRGSLNAVVANDATGDGAGALAWTFSVGDSELDNLAAGQVLTQTYDVTVADGKGGAARQSVTIQLTGSADNSAPDAVDDVLANVSYSFKGSYRVSDGAYWGNNPPVYSAAEAAAVVFGGAASDYAISTNASTINFSGWYDGWGKPWTVFAQDFKQDALPTGYYAPFGDAWSAYVRDHVDFSKVNYVWKKQDALLATEDAPLTIGASRLLGNDTDSDGDVLAITAISATSALGGVLVLNADGSIGYSAAGVLDSLNQGEVRQDSFSYTISDGQGGSDTATATFSVSGANDGPTAQDGAFAVAEDGTATGLALAVDDADADDDATTLVYALVEGPSAGTVTLDQDGHFSFDPQAAFQSLQAGQTASTSFTYRVTDRHGATDTAVVTLHVTGENDAPSATADDLSVNEDSALAGSVLANDVDVDGDTLVVAAVNGAADAVGQAITLASGATVTVQADGAFSYDQKGRFDMLPNGATATDSFTYTAVDGKGGTATQTVTLRIQGCNDAPVATNDFLAGISEDGACTIPVAALLANDSDPDAGANLTLSAVQITGTTGAVSLSGGTITYVAGSGFQYLKPGDTATDHFTYTLSDGLGGTAAGTVDVVVLGANDAPTAGDDSAFVNSGASVKLDVLANDSDPEGELLSLVSASGPAHGSATLNPDGTITYAPTAGYSGSDSFTYVMRDASGGTDTATVSLVVGFADHDKIGGDVFLQGNYMEIGVSSAGSLGTSNSAPTNYHPMDPGGRRISYVVDTDGWGTGAAPLAGDFTLPGSPVDTIVLGINGASYVQDQRSGAASISTTTVDVSSGSTLAARTTGSVAGAQFTQLIELEAGATYYKTTITVANASAGTLNDVRFMRSFDPDQDVYRYGTYNTFNDVLANPVTGSDIAVSRATGVASGVSVNLVAFDGSARASNFGFANYNAYATAAWDAPVDRNGASVDEAITLSFKMGNLAAGQQVTKVFYTSLNGAQGANDMTIGTTGGDVLNSGLGNDVLLGLAGNDNLTGNGGDDRFIFSKGSGADLITDFTAGAATDDVIELRGFGLASLADVRSNATQVGSNVQINLGGSDSLTLVGVALPNLHADDFAFF